MILEIINSDKWAWKNEIIYNFCFDIRVQWLLSDSLKLQESFMSHDGAIYDVQPVKAAEIA